MDEGMEIPPSVQDYLEKGPFKVYILQIVTEGRSSIHQALMKSHSLANMALKRIFHP
jgi:hypothetical protein